MAWEYRELKIALRKRNPRLSIDSEPMPFRNMLVAITYPIGLEAQSPGTTSTIRGNHRYECILYLLARLTRETTSELNVNSIDIRITVIE